MGCREYCGRPNREGGAWTRLSLLSRTWFIYNFFSSPLFLWRFFSWRSTYLLFASAVPAMYDREANRDRSCIRCRHPGLKRCPSAHCFLFRLHSPLGVCTASPPLLSPSTRAQLYPFTRYYSSFSALDATVAPPLILLACELAIFAGQGRRTFHVHRLQTKHDAFDPLPRTRTAPFSLVPTVELHSPRSMGKPMQFGGTLSNGLPSSKSQIMSLISVI